MPTNPTIGTDYDHIDAMNLGAVTGVVRHMLKDAQARTDIAGMSTATAEDVGKALKPKTVTNGKVTEWEFGEVGVQVDDTLTQAGKAADAKKTGDEISALKSAFTKSFIDNEPELTYTDGYINTSGTISTSGITAKHSNLVKLPNGAKFVVPDFTYDGVPYVCVIGFYSGNAFSVTNFISASAVYSVAAGNMYEIPTGATYAAISYNADAVSNGTFEILSYPYAEEIEEYGAAIADIQNYLTSRTDFEYTLTSGKYINTAGTLSNGESYSWTNLVALNGATKIYLNKSLSTGQYVTAVGFYKGNAFSVSNFITPGINITTANAPITVPDGALYFAVSAPSTDLQGLIIYTTQGVKESIEELEQYVDDNRTFEATKVGVAFGDSLTQGIGVLPSGGAVPTNDVVSVLSRMLGCTMYNAGIGGTTLWRWSEQTTALHRACFPNVVDAVVSGDWATINAAIAEMETPTELQTQFAAVEALDFSEIDFVTISYGTNDWFAISAQRMDNENDPYDKATVCGGLRYGIKALQTAYPQLRIYVFTPTYIYMVPASVDANRPDSDELKINGISLLDLANALVSASSDVHVPCCQRYGNEQMSKYNASRYFVDGLHLNANGYAVLGSINAKFINSH